MKTGLLVAGGLAVLLLLLVLYFGFYNTNLPFLVNLFGFFSWSALNVMLKESVCG